MADNRRVSEIVEDEKKKKAKVHKLNKRHAIFTTVAGVLLLGGAIFTSGATILVKGTIGSEAKLSKENLVEVVHSVQNNTNRVKEVISWVDIENRELNLPESLVDDTKTIGISKTNAFILKETAESSGLAERNMMISPSGLKSALRMLTFASDGDTYTKLVSFTGKSIKDLSSDSVGVYNYFIVNSKKGLPVTVNSDYKSLLEDTKGIEAEAFILRDNKTELLTQLVNNAIFKATNGKLKDTLGEEVLKNPEFIASLGNVIYFKGEWEESELPVDVIEFHKADDTEVEVDAVVFDEDLARYFYTSSVEGFKADYKDNRYSFYGFLSKDDDNFDVTTLKLTELREPSDKDYTLDVKIPEFELVSDLNLNKPLEQQGLGIIFDKEEADFTSGFDYNPNLTDVYVQNVIQNTAITFDRYGTEASTNTRIDMALDMAMAPENKEKYKITFDRPFYFMIYDNETNEPLFVGQVYEPNM